MTASRLGGIVVTASCLLALGALATGCFQWSTGFEFQDHRRFQHRPGSLNRVKAIARIDETLWGMNLFGINVRPIQPEALREKYLANPNYRVTNWQLLTGNLDVPYLDMLMIFPYCRVSFDIVEVEELAP
jgi:hypothetical protein